MRAGLRHLLVRSRYIRAIWFECGQWPKSVYVGLSSLQPPDFPANLYAQLLFGGAYNVTKFPIRWLLRIGELLLSVAGSFDAEEAESHTD
jgi:hypothetical protein